MSIGLTASALSTQALSVRGVRLSCARAGLYKKNPERMDMVLMEADVGSHISLQLTKNRFAAAPVIWCQEHLAHHRPDAKTYALINAGNANAGTGQQGLDDVARLHQSLVECFACPPAQFLPFSTGVIGEYLPIDALVEQIPHLVDNLSSQSSQWLKSAAAIMTTDTVVKLASIELTPARESAAPIHLTAFAKGSGMIHPNMATMLCFLACDAAVSPDWFDAQIRQAVDNSFNCISVDGDTSTNDACLSILTGAGEHQLDSDDEAVLSQAIGKVLGSLARQIIEDGEGANLLFKVLVRGAHTVADARAVATAVATSPLVKTAIGARDPNWGRILAAVGRAPIDSLAIEKVDIGINGVRIVHSGQRCSQYREDLGVKALSADSVEIIIDLNTGQAQGHCLGCDLSAEYVRINSDYRS